MTLIHQCEHCRYCPMCHKTSCRDSSIPYLEVENDGWVTKLCPYCNAVIEKFETLQNIRDKENQYEDLMKKIKATQNAVMQSGLPVIVFNKPIKNDQIWDIKVFWKIPDEKTSEAFDDVLACFEDCLKYIESRDKKD